jgi:hypothetical protein
MSDLETPLEADEQVTDEVLERMASTDPEGRQPTQVWTCFAPCPGR